MKKFLLLVMSILLAGTASGSNRAKLAPMALTDIQIYV